MQGWAGQCPSSRRSPHLHPGRRPSNSKLSEREESLNQLRRTRRVSQFSGLLLGFSLYSYHVRELLVRWLFISLSSSSAYCVLMALMILGGILACYAGKYATHWASTTASIAPVPALGSAELHLKTVSGARKFN
jgi:hypothetical protein